MTFYILDPHRLTGDLDAEDLAPLIRQALVIRLQLGAVLLAYLLAAFAIAAGLASLIGRLS